MEQARGLRLKTQCAYIGYIASSISVLGPRRGWPRYTDFMDRTFSRYNEANPSRLAVLRSPPEPFTQRTSTSAPVSGSFSTSFDDVFPPPVLVRARSSPSLFER